MRIRELKTTNDRSFALGSLNVLIGPNNAGKSQTLRDINTRIVSPTSRAVVVSEVVPEKPPRFEDLLVGLTVHNNPNNATQSQLFGLQGNLTNGHSQPVQMEKLERRYQGTENMMEMASELGRFWTAHLDAATRLQIASGCPSHNVASNPPERLPQALYDAGIDAELELRNVFRRTFSLDIRLDYSNLQQFVFRIAEDFGSVPADPREAYPIMQRFSTLDNQGDGYRSFVGVVLALLFCSNRIVLIDEPEAFLHPMQARQLGQWIGEHVLRSRGQVIIATHDPSFLMGTLSSGAPVDIFRLQRTGTETNFHHVSPQSIEAIAASPLLSSQRVLESLFHSGVVVCEADADRALYQLVADKYLGRSDLFFLHAHNRQTLAHVVELLRECCVPVCAIADLDLLTSEPEFKALYKALTSSELPEEEKVLRHSVAAKIADVNEADALQRVEQAIAQLLEEIRGGRRDLSSVRSAVNDVRKKSSRWAAIKGGIGRVPTSVECELLDLIARMGAVGLYLVPVGELEGWIDVPDVSRKSEWIARALRMVHTQGPPHGLKEFVSTLVPR